MVVREGIWESQRNITRIVGKGDLCYIVGESSMKVSPVVWEVDELCELLKEIPRQYVEDANDERRKERPAGWLSGERGLTPSLV